MVVIVYPPKTITLEMVLFLSIGGKLPFMHFSECLATTLDGMGDLCSAFSFFGYLSCAKRISTNACIFNVSNSMIDYGNIGQTAASAEN